MNDELKSCPWCEGQTKRFQMQTTEGVVVEMVEHQGWPHCCVRRDTMTLDQWQTRSTPTIDDEVVERVARAIHDARFENIGAEWKPPPTRDYSDHEYCLRLARAAARAALSAAPR